MTTSHLYKHRYNTNAIVQIILRLFSLIYTQIWLNKPYRYRMEKYIARTKTKRNQSTKTQIKLKKNHKKN